MDWTLALQHNQGILLRNILWLFKWLKVEAGGSVETLPRLQWRTALFVLRPSESACRRLVLVTVFLRGIVAPPWVERVSTPKRKTPEATSKRAPARSSFRLIGPRKNFDLHPDKPKYAKGPGPWVTDLWSDDPIYDRSVLYAYQERLNRPRAEDVSAAALFRRMNALVDALNDLPAQAKRMASLQARLERQYERTGKPNLWPVRPGLPPGFRKRKKHEVDAVLTECHQLALMARQEFKPPGTS